MLNPGWGDAVQANKAGLLEVADIFVINKADRPGVDDTRRDIEQMLELSRASRLGPADHPNRRDERRGCRAAVGGIDKSTGNGSIDSGELARRRHARITHELERIVAARLLERSRALGSRRGVRRTA